MVFLRTANPNRKCRYCDAIMPFRKRVCDQCSKRKCKRCQNPAEPGKRSCADCAAKSRAEYAHRLEVDPIFRQQNRDRAKRNHWKDNETNKAKLRDRSRATHRRDKIEAINRYGGCCVCCGETDYRFLTFDHSHGDGKAHRMSLCNGRHRTLGSAFVRKLRMTGWPDVPGMQILCANCHMAKDLWGGCPHQERTRR